MAVSVSAQTAPLAPGDEQGRPDKRSNRGHGGVRAGDGQRQVHLGQWAGPRGVSSACGFARVRVARGLTERGDGRIVTCGLEPACGNSAARGSPLGAVGRGGFVNRLRAGGSALPFDDRSWRRGGRLGLRRGSLYRGLVGFLTSEDLNLLGLREGWPARGDGGERRVLLRGYGRLRQRFARKRLRHFSVRIRPVVLDGRHAAFRGHVLDGGERDALGALLLGDARRGE